MRNAKRTKRSKRDKKCHANWPDFNYMKASKKQKNTYLTMDLGCSRIALGQKFATPS
jgi:hypothetical protein